VWYYRQGCPLSLLLFEELMKMAMENCQDGISVGGKMLQSLHLQMTEVW